MDYSILSLVITIIIVLFTSAFISMAEASILSLNRNKFYVHKKEAGDTLHNKCLNKILQSKSEYISAIITLSTIFNVGGSVIIGAMTSTVFKPFTPLLINLNFIQFTINPNTLFAIFFTLIILYFSKMIPKLIGAQAPLRVSLFAAPILYYLHFIIKPISWLSHYICKPFVRGAEDSSISMLEIKHILKQAYKKNIIKEREFEIINNSLLLNQKTVKDIMKYSEDIESYPAANKINESINDILKFKHRRVLLTIGEKNEIPVGIVVVSDLMKAYIKGLDNNENKTLSDFAHELLVVNENDTLGHILADFNDSLDHIALIKKQDGSYLGILAIEDIFDGLTIGFNND